MRLEKLRIQNFRSYKDATIEFDPYTCLVGPNGCGKSTVLMALNVFFRNTTSVSTNVVKFSAEDFHHGNTDEPIQISLTFNDLSQKAQAELEYYYRQGRLTVSAKAVWSDEAKSAEVKQFGVRSVMKAFAPYFKAVQDGEKAPALKELYDQIQKEFADLPKATTGPAREKALRDFEEAHPERCEPLESETQFFGFTRGANLLANHVQWVYIPAVKDASTEQEEGSKGALKELLDRTIRSKVNFKEPIAELKQHVNEEYLKIIDSQKIPLAELTASLHTRLKEWASPNAMLKLGWHYDEDKSVVVNEPYARASIGEDNFIGEVARLGHGMQRSFLVALLHELASLNADEGPTLLLGFEEPELYQHPPQAQHMCNVLEGLAAAKKSNTQVVISTHSPYFVSSRGFENVRVIRKHNVDKCSLVASTTYRKLDSIISAALEEKPKMPAGTMAAIEQIMQPSQNELYFSGVAVFVEGLEDIGYIASHLTLRGQWLDFRRFGCHFIVTGGKTNMSRPLAIANELCIRAFTVFDCDSDEKDNNQLQKHARDNRCIFRLCGITDANPLPKDNAFFANCVAWSTRIEHVVRTEAGEKLWNDATKHVHDTLGLRGTTRKNKLFIAALLEDLSRRGFVSSALSNLGSAILSFAANSTPEPEPTLLEEITPSATKAAGNPAYIS